MGYLVIKVFPSGKVERIERARTWRDRERLIAFALWLQPGLAALDVAAGLWKELETGQSTRERSR